MSIFQVESEELIERIIENLINLEATPDNRDLTATLYRDLHSIKGAIRMVGFTNIQTIIHKIEDIFDIVNSSGIVLDTEKINLIIKSVELVSKYLQESVKNQREIIDDEFNPTVSSLEYLKDIDLQTITTTPPDILNDLANIAELADIDSIAKNLSDSFRLRS